MAKNDAKLPAGQVNQKLEQVPMHKRMAMGEALDGKSLSPKGDKTSSSSKQKK